MGARACACVARVPSCWKRREDGNCSRIFIFWCMAWLHCMEAPAPGCRCHQSFLRCCESAIVNLGVLRNLASSSCSMAIWPTATPPIGLPHTRHIGTFSLAWAEAIAGLGAGLARLVGGRRQANSSQGARAAGCPVPSAKCPACCMFTSLGRGWSCSLLHAEENATAGFPSIDEDRWTRGRARDARQLSPS